MENRVRLLRECMTKQGLAAVVVTKPENRRYFSGFTGSAGTLLISAESAQLFTDFRYVEQAATQAPYFQIERYNGQVFTALKEVIDAKQWNAIGFEKNDVTFAVYEELLTVAPAEVWNPLVLDQLRMQKDAEELKLTRKAVEIADAAFQHVLTLIRPGLTEKEVAWELENHMRRMGSQKPAFDTIVASGVRGALPHGRASEKVINSGELVTMDFGAVYEGYHSDMTRTICVGKADAKQREVYEVVRKAQLAGVAAVQAGKLGQEVDAVARQVIADAGYGDYFGHGLGHGVGLAIHEEPRLSPANTTIALDPGMLVTVEPGIYIPEWGGIRIEDTVLVSANGCEILTASSKELIEI